MSRFQRFNSKNTILAGCAQEARFCNVRFPLATHHKFASAVHIVHTLGIPVFQITMTDIPMFAKPIELMVLS